MTEIHVVERKIASLLSPGAVFPLAPAINVIINQFVCSFPLIDSLRVTLPSLYFWAEPLLISFLPLDDLTAFLVGGNDSNRQDRTARGVESTSELK